MIDGQSFPVDGQPQFQALCRHRFVHQFKLRASCLWIGIPRWSTHSNVCQQQTYTLHRFQAFPLSIHPSERRARTAHYGWTLATTDFTGAL